MKKLWWIGLGVGIMLTSCSSSSKMGYAHFDDMYEDRPYYAEQRRNAQQEYSPAQTQRTTRDNQVADNAYQDDEVMYGSYEERINRFHRNRGRFDYYSPFNTGFATGFNSGFNQGLQMGLSSGWGFNSGFGVGFGWGYNWNFWNRPWYSSSFQFGWGNPWIWYDPFFDPWGWNNPFWNPWSWNRPIGGWYNPWGSPWGWGNPIIIINNDYNNNRNRYYGPRSGSFNNSYYNSKMGGRNNSISTTPPQQGITPRPSMPNNSGIQMEKREKNINTPPSTPTTPPSRGISPRTPESQPSPTPAPERKPRMETSGNNLSPQYPTTPSGIDNAPKFRYSTPKYPAPTYQRGYRNIQSPKPISPSRPSLSTPSSPSLHSPGRSASPSVAPGRSPVNNNGMERRPK